MKKIDKLIEILDHCNILMLTGARGDISPIIRKLKEESLKMSPMQQADLMKETKAFIRYLTIRNKVNRSLFIEGNNLRDALRGSDPYVKELERLRDGIYIIPGRRPRRSKFITFEQRKNLENI